MADDKLELIKGEGVKLGKVDLMVAASSKVSSMNAAYIDIINAERRESAAYKEKLSDFVAEVEELLKGYE